MFRNVLIFLILAGMSGVGVAPAETGRKSDGLEKIVKSYALRGTLESLIPQLEKFGGVKIAVDWPALKKTGVEKTEKVQLRGTNEKFIDIVELVLAQVEKPHKPLAWRRSKSGVLQITTQSNVIRRRFGASDETTLPDRPLRRRASRVRQADIRFENTRLEDVLETLRNASGVNFFINWSSLKTVGITRDTPITLQARNLSTARVLDLVMLELNGDKGRLTSVHWVIDKGLVRVDTGEVLDTVMRTKVEDVTDLLRITPNFTGPRIKADAIGNLSTNKNQKGASKMDVELWEDDDEPEEPERESPAELRAYQKNQLIESIKNSIGRDMWYPNGRGTINIFRNQLVITQSLLGWKLMERGNR